jgi:uncharacterized protein
MRCAAQVLRCAPLRRRADVRGMVMALTDPHAAQRLLMSLVRGYRLLLSPWLGSSCRFEPTCSAYALEALARHGAAVGSRLTAVRLLRCHPGCAGGLDAVPASVAPFFSSLLDRARRPHPAASPTGGRVPSRKNPP